MQFRQLQPKNSKHMAKCNSCISFERCWELLDNRQLGCNTADKTFRTAIYFVVEFLSDCFRFIQTGRVIFVLLFYYSLEFDDILELVLRVGSFSCLSVFCEVVWIFYFIRLIRRTWHLGMRCLSYWDLFDIGVHLFHVLVSQFRQSKIIEWFGSPYVS